MIRLYVILGVAILLTSCGEKVTPPTAYGPVPSQAQLDWHELEYISLVCYGLNTYTEQEWAFGDVDPKLFNPSNLDTDQWARTAKDAGMKGLILVAKHHDGFCLWPSKYTNYSVKATPWKDGKGDVLRDLSKSCKKYGLKLGVYLSPWDRNHADYGKAEYVDYFYKQLEELLTEYGDIFEFWIDGANGGTGYYGGANDKRSIDRETYYGYDIIFSMVKKHQPNAVIFSDVGPGVRWVGNEAGIGSETNWNRISTNGKLPGDPDPEFNKILGTGDPKGKEWIPAEVNTTLLWPKAWYYHTGHQPRSLKNLMDLYYTSIGRGSPLDLGLAIAPSGQIRAVDAQVLARFNAQLKLEFDVDLIQNAIITASDYRGENSEYAPDKTGDLNNETYWATNQGVQNASMFVDFNKEVTFNRLLLQEYIRLGQRIHKFILEVETGEGWKEVAQGTTIGYKRILRFDNVTATKAKITFETNAPCLTLSNIGIYNAPPLLAEPKINGDKYGKVSLSVNDDLDLFYAIGNAPGESDYQQYHTPLELPLGSTVSAYALHRSSGQKSDITTKRIGIAKGKWKIHAVGNSTERDATKAIDGNSATCWETFREEKNKPLYMAIDLGEKISLSGFSYVPPDLGSQGSIFEYEFYVSDDGTHWGEPVSSGEFSNIENNPIAQHIKFDHTLKANYIKLVSKSSINNNKKVVINEIEIFTDQ
jgi:alpha-L-fucosidase